MWTLAFDADASGVREVERQRGSTVIHGGLHPHALAEQGRIDRYRQRPLDRAGRRRDGQPRQRDDRGAGSAAASRANAASPSLRSNQSQPGPPAIRSRSPSPSTSLNVCAPMRSATIGRSDVVRSSRSCCAAVGREESARKRRAKTGERALMR